MWLKIKVPFPHRLEILSPDKKSTTKSPLWHLFWCLLRHLIVTGNLSSAYAASISSYPIMHQGPHPPPPSPILWSTLPSSSPKTKRLGWVRRWSTVQVFEANSFRIFSQRSLLQHADEDFAVFCYAMEKIRTKHWWVYLMLPLSEKVIYQEILRPSGSRLEQDDEGIAKKNREIQVFSSPKKTRKIPALFPLKAMKFLKPQVALHRRKTFASSFTTQISILLTIIKLSNYIVSINKPLLSPLVYSPPGS